MEMWILGKKYDTKTKEGRAGIVNLIDNARDREAFGDLSMIAFALMSLTRGEEFPKGITLTQEEMTAFFVLAGSIGELRREVESLKKTIRMGELVVEDFMPNIGKCVLQDYGRLNQFLMDAAQIEQEELNAS